MKFLILLLMVSGCKLSDQMASFYYQHGPLEITSSYQQSPQHSSLYSNSLVIKGSGLSGVKKISIEQQDCQITQIRNDSIQTGCLFGMI